MGLYALYGMAEIAIVATDLAELLGSAIALNLCVFSRQRATRARVGWASLTDVDVGNQAVP